MILNSKGFLTRQSSFILALLMMFAVNHSTNGQNINNQLKLRIVITSDPELDDNNSLIRFLLYSSDVNVEGLIYSSSQFHWKGDGTG